MRNIIFPCVALFLLSEVTGAESSSNDLVDLHGNISLLENKCGYVLGENISSKVIRSLVSENEKIASFDFYLRMRLENRSIRGKLSFSCFVAGSRASEPGVVQKTTAADEIALEDSGGRYARDIVWQRKYEGKGWDGTVAYVNSVFGDQERRAAPDYFLICPNKGGFSCFSFEVVKGRLSRMESDRIPRMLGGIGIIDLRSTAPEKSDMQR
ncbi:hypothetical protein [Burkholderia stagnalis]|uniref:hypothetical protein n=1 Tax=Burkholderia stagnalis TaxID=1503054 RepID=UPI000F58A717|nr:hypothetical protein [Burkholderia stagnalis]